MITLNGKAVAERLKTAAKREVAAAKNCRKPSLVIISVGDDDASELYVRNKMKACGEVGITVHHEHFAATASEEDVAAYIDKKNDDAAVDAIMLQLPVPAQFNSAYLVNKINLFKDVDGLTASSAGMLRQNLDADMNVSCTAMGIVDLLNHYSVPIAGRHVVIIGRSNIVGKPLADLMLNKDATVSLCHSKTIGLKSIAKTADILVSAVGKSNFVTADMVKPGAAVIDVGINRSEDGEICGDVEAVGVAQVADYLTPVPGGVGPMTEAELVVSVVRLWKRNQAIAAELS